LPLTGAARRDALATLAIVGAIGALAVGRPLARRLARHPTPERCASMLARWSEQEARSRERVPVPASVSLASPDVARCTSDLTDAEVECALHAGYVDEIERCLP
jgi:hypothetical protein